MQTKLLIAVAAIASLAACAPRAAAPVLASRAPSWGGCQSGAATVEQDGSAVLVEGFGGRGESQLIVTERQARLLCALPTAATGGGTLAPVR